MPRASGERVEDLGVSRGHGAAFLRLAPALDGPGESHAAERDQCPRQQEREQPHPPAIAPFQHDGGLVIRVVPAGNGVAESPGLQTSEGLFAIARQRSPGRPTPVLDVAGHGPVADTQARLPRRATQTIGRGCGRGRGRGASGESLAEDRAGRRQESMVDPPLGNRHAGKKQATEGQTRGQQNRVEGTVSERCPGLRAGAPVAQFLAKKPRKPHTRSPRRQPHYAANAGSLDVIRRPDEARARVHPRKPLTGRRGRSWASTAVDRRDILGPAAWGPRPAAWDLEGSPPASRITRLPAGG